MSDDILKTHLAELEELIHQAREDGTIDSAERDEIAALVERVRDDLTASAGAADDVTEAAVRFETKHPRLTEVLRAVSDTLSGYGI